MMATKKKAPAKKATKAKAVPKPAQAKTPKPAPAPAEKLSQIAAAERVLAGTDGPMICVAMVEAIVAKGFWNSLGGKTPEAALDTAVTMVPKCAPLGAFSKRAG